MEFRIKFISRSKLGVTRINRKLFDDVKSGRFDSEKRREEKRQVGRDSRVTAIRPHALTQKVNVGGLRIEARQCRVRWSRYRTADSAINQSVSAPNRRPAALIRDEFDGASFRRNITAILAIVAVVEAIATIEYFFLLHYDSWHWYLRASKRNITLERSSTVQIRFFHTLRYHDDGSVCDTHLHYLRAKRGSWLEWDNCDVTRDAYAKRRDENLLATLWEPVP